MTLFRTLGLTPVAIFNFARIDLAFWRGDCALGKRAEVFKGCWFSLAHVGNVLRITLNANQNPASPGSGGRSLSRSISSCHCSWDFRKALSE